MAELSCGRFSSGVLTALTILAALSAACGGNGAPGGKIRVYAAIPPQAYIVARVGGPSVEVGTLVSGGQSPHTFEPTPRQVADLARAQVYFRGGLPFETALAARLARSFPGLEIVDLRQGIALRKMEEPLWIPGAGKGDSDDTPGAPDPHVWLDPTLVAIQADTVCASLGRLHPELAGQFRDNLAHLKADLDSVDRQVAALLAPFRGSTFYVLHPSFGYFAARYGLTQAAIETGGKEPSAQQLARLIDSLNTGRVRVIFVQRQFSSVAARNIQNALGLRLEPLDPLAPDYPDNLVRMARSLAAAFEQSN